MGRRRAVSGAGCQWRSRRSVGQRQEAALDGDGLQSRGAARLRGRPGVGAGAPDVALVHDNCRWEHAGQPFFSGEVEPCINGRTVTLGTYFDQDVDGVVARLLGEQLEDGGWNCEAENGSVRSSLATTLNVLEGLLANERATGDLINL